MSHHELLAAAAGGLAVVLTHHSKCERGFLPVMQQRLADALRQLELPAEVLLAKSDADPLTIL
jgi:putative NIF3 family GTP cyclohydrolase 1 type 2